jgi:hypothetical protein
MRQSTIGDRTPEEFAATVASKKKKGRGSKAVGWTARRAK